MNFLSKYKKKIAREWLILICISVSVTILYGLTGYYFHTKSEREYSIAKSKYDDKMNIMIREKLADWKPERPIILTAEKDHLKKPKKDTDPLFTFPEPPEPYPTVGDVKYEIATRVRQIFPNYSEWKVEEIMKCLPELAWSDFPRKPRYISSPIFGEDSLVDLLQGTLFIYFFISVIRSIIWSIKTVRAK